MSLKHCIIPAVALARVTYETLWYNVLFERAEVSWIELIRVFCIIARSSVCVVVVMMALALLAGLVSQTDSIPSG